MEGFCLKTGIQRLSPAISISGGADSRKPPLQVSALGRSASTPNLVSLENSAAGSRFSISDPLRSLLRGREKGNDEIVLLEDGMDEAETEEAGETGEEGDENEPMGSEKKRGGSWVLKILRIRSLWKQKSEGNGEGDVVEEEEKEEEVKRNCSCEEEQSEDSISREEMEEFDRDSFSRLLRRVSLSEARLYAQMSYLGSLAYNILSIKPEHLLQYQGLRFVTSSLEKKAQGVNAEKDQTPEKSQETGEKSEAANEVVEHNYKKSESQISAFTAYRIAAAAASYVQSTTRNIFPFNSMKGKPTEESTEGGDGANESAELTSSEVASFVATTNSLTAVIAAKEEMKQAVVKDLNSVHSSPCEWYVCDDDQTGTRFFVIQGSETISSWQANLLFEPIQFEGLDVLVHRGIYEAAKGIYEQMLPEIRLHLKSHGDSAKFRFTGHSLGGSLSLLVNLMLVIRHEVPLSTLLPVITFGAPSIMCGGDQLLHRLGLPRNHVQAITMHRDIVPRTFSCKYPDHVIDILKAVNGNFRNHPCLKNQKFLYGHTGEILILQPDEKISPHHDLLPSGNGLYCLSSPMSDMRDPEKLLQAAKSVFLNSPHPLEILSDRSSYGSGGAMYRDHDMKAYLRSVRGVIRQELNRIRKAQREQRRRMWWPLIVPQRTHHTGINIGRQEMVSSNLTQHQMRLFGIRHTGGKSLKRFSRLVASQHVHILVVLLFPARLVLMGFYTMFNLQ